MTPRPIITTSVALWAAVPLAAGSGASSTAIPTTASAIRPSCSP